MKKRNVESLLHVCVASVDYTDGVMSNARFESLSAELQALREEHAEWCADVNGCRLPESSYEAYRRDKAYARIVEIEELIGQALEAERAEEEAQ